MRPDRQVIAASPENAAHAPIMFAELGIRFVVVEDLPRTKIDGAAFFLNNDPQKPVIVLSPTPKAERFGRITACVERECIRMAENISRPYGRTSTLPLIRLWNSLFPNGEEELLELACKVMLTSRTTMSLSEATTLKFNFLLTSHRTLRTSFNPLIIIQENSKVWKIKASCSSVSAPPPTRFWPCLREKV